MNDSSEELWQEALARGKSEIMVACQIHHLRDCKDCGRLLDALDRGWTLLSDLRFLREGLEEAQRENERLGADAKRMDWLEAQGVESIYLHRGRRFNPASQCLRAAIDTAMQSTPTEADDHA